MVATRNRGKLREIAAVLADLPLVVRGLWEFPHAPPVRETGATYAENACLKALGAARATGCLALADDSGLEVEALDGRPGVLSARYAGEGAGDEALCRKVLSELSGVPRELRGARFVCVVAVARAQGVLWTVEGTCSGRVAEEMRGHGGFGYDPIFLAPSVGRTFAELTAEQKNAMSHRGRALRKARQKLLGELRGGGLGRQGSRR